MYRDKRKNRRLCTYRKNRRFNYEAVVRGGMYREKRKNRRACIDEAVARGGGRVQREKEREEGMYI